MAARALVQLVHARVRGAGDVEWGGPVEVELRVLVYVREEGVRVEEACRQDAYGESEPSLYSHLSRCMCRKDRGAHRGARRAG